MTKGHLSAAPLPSAESKTNAASRMGLAALTWKTPTRAGSWHSTSVAAPAGKSTLSRIEIRTNWTGPYLLRDTAQSGCDNRPIG